MRQQTNRRGRSSRPVSFPVIWVLAVVVGLVCGLADAESPQDGDGDQSEASARAKESFEQLIEATKYEQTLALVNQWKETLDEATLQELVGRLKRGLSSQRPCPMQTGGRILIASRFDRSVTTPTDDAFWILQDVLTEGGRCAWAAERLLECYLPHLTDDLTDDQRQAAVTEALKRIDAAMQPPRAINIDTLPKADRLKFAGSEESHDRVLTKLAEDPSVEVRRAVASNRYTPKPVLMDMYQDDDAHVRQLAQDNFILIPPPRLPWKIQ